MRVLVCGGRDLCEADVWNWLERFGHQDASEAVGYGTRITSLIHGGASGADRGAARWGQSEGIRVTAYPANWRKHGKAAGPIRNTRMLAEGKPELVIAFPGGRGTADMTRQADAAGVRILYPARLGFTNPTPIRIEDPRDEREAGR